MKTCITKHGIYTIKGAKGNRYAEGRLFVYFNPLTNGAYTSALDGVRIGGPFPFLCLAQRCINEHQNQNQKEN